MDRRPSGAAASGPPSLLPSLSLLLLLSLSLLLWTGGALCRHVRPEVVVHGLPAEYKARLQVLKLALALNEDWSPVWSEKLHAKAVVARHPDADFCMRLIPDVGEAPAAGIDANDAKDAKDVEDAGDPKAAHDDKEPKHAAEHHHDDPEVDTYLTIRKIVDYCSFSGSYVRFGMELLAASVHCLFCRHSRFNLSAVSALVEHADDGYVGYLRALVDDYMEVVDKLAVVGAQLKHVVQLVTFYDDVARRAVELSAQADRLPGAGSGHAAAVAKFHRDVRELADALRLRMNEELRHTCAVDEDDWYDKDRGVVVSLLEIEDPHAKEREKELKKQMKEMKKKKKKKKNKGKEDTDEEGEGDKKDKKDKKKKDKDKEEDKKEGGEQAEGDKEKDGDGKEGDEKKEKKDKKKDKHEESPVSLLERANELRLLMRKVFEKLLIREMPTQMWKEIFTNNILVKPADIKSVPKKKAAESLSFVL